MGLDSTSTLQEVQAAYDNNAAYDIDRSVSKCKAFIEACRILLRRLTSRQAQRGGVSFEREQDVRLIQEEMQRAERWLAANDTTSTTTSGRRYLYPDFTDFR